MRIKKHDKAYIVGHVKGAAGLVGLFAKPQ